MSYNQEACSQQHGLHVHIQVQRELDAEVVSVCESFFYKTTPLLADVTNRLTTIFTFELQNT